MERLRGAARREFISEDELQQRLRSGLRDIYERLVDRGAIMRTSPDVGRFALERVRPQLRDELDRRTMASAQLIRLNRDAAVEATLRRFAGWATSIPPGGSGAVDRRSVKPEVQRSLRQIRFIERRVAVDQGHKFAANLSEILAVDSGALAGIWRQHYTRYPRHSHRQRNGRVYAVRGNWALERGLMRAGPAGYTDEVTRPGEEVFCRCSYEWIHALRRLPADMLTAKGRAELQRVREAA